MKKIGFIGCYDKTDLMIYIAKILVATKKKVLVIDSTVNQKAKYIVPIVAQNDGTIVQLDALTIGKLSCYLGAGREKKEDDINTRVGFVFNKKVGDTVKNGEIIGYIHSDDEAKAQEILQQEIIKIS